MVLWLLGISGSGKSTLANMLKARYEKQGKRPYIIDGDTVRDFYDNDLGYTAEDREANIKRIMLAARVLDDNDIFAIVANISPFERLRDFARKKIKGYTEVYLKKNISVSINNDVKGVYRSNKGKTELVGIDMPFEEPGHSELVISVDDETPEESCEKIVALLKRKDFC